MTAVPQTTAPAGATSGTLLLTLMKLRTFIALFAVLIVFTILAPNFMSTANLMSDFYGRLTRGSAPAEALRQAKLKLVHSTGASRKPFYWGPFQLYSGSGM